MKKVIIIFIVALVAFSCNNKQSKEPDKKGKKVELSSLLTASELQLLQGEEATASPNAKGKKHQVTNQVTLGTTATITLTHVSGSDFTINYGGATDVVWHFFRGTDSLAANGNVYPTATQSFYLNPVTSFTSNFTRTFYQSVVVTGTTTPDANGVIGTDWVFNYSNVVQ